MNWRARQQLLLCRPIASIVLRVTQITSHFTAQSPTELLHHSQITSHFTAQSFSCLSVLLVQSRRVWPRMLHTAVCALSVQGFPDHLRRQLAHPQHHQQRHLANNTAGLGVGVDSGSQTIFNGLGRHGLGYEGEAVCKVLDPLCPQGQSTAAGTAFATLHGRVLTKHTLSSAFSRPGMWPHTAAACSMCVHQQAAGRCATAVLSSPQMSQRLRRSSTQLALSSTSGSAAVTTSRCTV
jgi:hypothetical protein